MDWNRIGEYMVLHHPAFLAAVFLLTFAVAYSAIRWGRNDPFGFSVGFAAWATLFLGMVFWPPIVHRAIAQVTVK